MGGEGVGGVMTEYEAAHPLVVLIEDEPEVLTTLTRQVHRLLPQATITSVASMQRTMRAGYLSILPFQTRRAWS